jgi:alkylhydroperoxidase family enzyme
MPRIPPLPESQIEDDLLTAIHEAHDERVLSSILPLKIWSRRPRTAFHWLQTLRSFYRDSLLDDRLRELVRLRIASITRCTLCQIGRKSEDVSELDIACLSGDNEHFSPREQAALQFAELFAADYLAIGDQHFQRLRNYFCDAAIVELNLFCALMLAGGRASLVLDAFEDTS